MSSRAAIGTRERAQSELTAIGQRAAAASPEPHAHLRPQGHAAVVLPVVAAFLASVGLLAALAPARRGLRINPTEALRDS